MLRNLAYRENDGISVSLDWLPSSGRVTVSVEDLPQNDRFTLVIHPTRALDAFYHPFSHRSAMLGGIARNRVLAGTLMRAPDER